MLLDLPNELILLIANNLPQADINALQQTNHQLHTLFEDFLYHYNALYCGSSVLALAAWEGLDSVAEKSLRQKGDPMVKLEKLRGEEPSDIPISSLHAAARGGHVGVVRLMLDYGADIEAKCLDAGLDDDAEGEGEEYELRCWDEDGATPLTVAAEFDHTEVFELLIERGANIEARDLRNKTPLHRATETGCTRIVKRLLELGAVVDARCKYGNTPLSQAARGRNAEIIRILLAAGADIEARNHTNRTPLYLAMLNHHTEGVNALVESGASVQALNLRAGNLLRLAARRGFTTLVDWALHQGEDVERRHFGGMTALHLAAMGEHVDTVQRLLNAGADIHAKDYQDCTPLLWAAARGDILIVKLLLDQRSDIDHCARHRRQLRTAVSVAMLQYRYTIVELLIDRGANVNSGDFPLLWYAVQRTQRGMISLLLSKGANPNILGGRTTALYYAVKNHDEETVGLLLEHGADPNYGSPFFNWSRYYEECPSPFGCAMKQKLYRVAEMLLDHGADLKLAEWPGRRAVAKAIEIGNHTLLEKVLAAGVNTNEIERHGLTPIFLAVVKGDERAVRLLLSHGADRSTKRDGCSMLHWARRRGFPAVEEILREYGAE
ncbi:hypothetical protein AWENTII_003020 [Aspergillus wentii]